MKVVNVDPELNMSQQDWSMIVDILMQFVVEVPA